MKLFLLNTRLENTTIEEKQENVIRNSRWLNRVPTIVKQLECFEWSWTSTGLFYRIKEKKNDVINFY